MSASRKAVRHPFAPASVVAFGLLLAAPLTAAPALQFQPSSVTGSGVTPAGNAVFFSVSRQAGAWMDHTVPRVEAVTDLDGDGAVDFALGGALAERSIWALVDVANGTFCVDGPDGFEPQEVAFDPPAAFKKGMIGDRRQSLELLVVRPGVGAWHGRLFDGAAGDLSAASDGMVVTDLAQLTWVDPGGVTGIPAQLSSLQTGDLVIGIDPVHLEYYTFHIQPAGKS